MAQKKENKSTDNKKRQPFLIKTYLFGYNFLQVIGWSYLFLQLVSHYTNQQSSSLYESVKWTLIIFQNAAVLEIFNAVTRLVPSNPIITTFQVFSRVMVVCGVLIPTVGGQESPGLPLTLFAWTITEIIRYLYYTLNIVGFVPHVLVWLRYTTFIILYPIGVTGELLCFYGAQSEIATTGMWIIDLPNALNFSFNYRYILLFLMMLYIPLFPQMYLHMFAQRKKILGGPKKEKV